MKKFECTLKRLISLSNGGCDLLYSEDLDIPENELQFLAAKGFISLSPWGDSDYCISLCPAGVTYFSDKRDTARTRWFDRLWGFLSGVAVAVMAEAIVRALLK